MVQSVSPFDVLYKEKNLLYIMLPGKDLAKPCTIAIPWTHVPVDSKLEIALQGNPSPTSSLRPLTKLRVARSSNWGPHGCPVNAQQTDAIVPDVLLMSFPAA